MSDAQAYRTRQILNAVLLVLATLVAAASAVAETSIGNTESVLPEPVSNNAVAWGMADGQTVLVSLMGLGPEKTWRDVHARVYARPLPGSAWSTLPPVPGPGRLAGTAVQLGGDVIVIGGYTVAEDGNESSVSRVQRLHLARGDYTDLAPMPVPVDDTVALVYKDRYVYLVSGWHDHGNVNLVQVYDAETDRWSQATPFPGRPLFGHAGGIVDRTLVICDGVALRTHVDRPRGFEAEPACFVGVIDAADPRRIEWRRLPHHGGPGLYRAAATGSARLGLIVFAGGSDNPYNYDGIGYDGSPSAPSARVFGYRVADGRWLELGELPVASMDHRGLVEYGDDFFLIGGMRERQQVSDQVLRFRLPMTPKPVRQAVEP